MGFLNWFIDPVKHHYADFSGRVSRKTYWMFVLVYIILAIAIAIVESIIGLNILGLIFSLAILVPSIAIATRRLHDTGLSGWFQLIALIPILGAIVLIVLLVRKGEAGANKYGPSTDGSVAPMAAVVPTMNEPMAGQQ